MKVVLGLLDARYAMTYMNLEISTMKNASFVDLRYALYANNMCKNSTSEQINASIISAKQLKNGCYGFKYLLIYDIMKVSLSINCYQISKQENISDPIPNYQLKIF